MNHESEEYQAMQRELAAVYAKFGHKGSGRVFERTQPMSARHPIRHREDWLARINAGYSMAIIGAVITGAVGVGFIVGFVWAMVR